MTDLLPLFVNLAGRRVLLVGGGPVAAAKLAQLLAAGADVLVVAPEVHADIERSGVADRAPRVQSGRPRRCLAGRRGGDAGGQPRGGRGGGAAPDVRQRGGRSGERDRVSERRRPARRRDAGDLDERRRAGADRRSLREALDAVLPRDLGRWMGEARRRAGDLEARRRADGGAPAAAARGAERLYDAATASADAGRSRLRIDWRSCCTGMSRSSAPAPAIRGC